MQSMPNIPGLRLKKQIAHVIWGQITDRQWHDWRWQLRNRLTTLSATAPIWPLSQKQSVALGHVTKTYPFSVTPYYLSLCALHDAYDPIRRQFYPDQRELLDGRTAADPLRESNYRPVPGLIHRYRNRVVVIVTTDCAVRCRHCTRKNTLPVIGLGGNMPYCSAARCAANAPHLPAMLRIALQAGRGTLHVRSPSPPTMTDALPLPSFGENSFARRLPQIVKYIRGRKEIREVILSGGDPLLLETSALDAVMDELSAIKNVEVMRIGTRAPVVLPMRIDAELCACLARHRPLWINTQFNHPRELTAEAIQACRRLQEAGLPVSNQAVLMRGVNNSFEILAGLCNELQRIMVRPYYLFQCDPVRGVNHFITSPAESKRLAKRLRRELGGLSMPLFVADVPGQRNKIPIELSCSARACHL